MKYEQIQKYTLSLTLFTYINSFAATHETILAPAKKTASMIYDLVWWGGKGAAIGYAGYYLIRMMQPDSKIEINKMFVAIASIMALANLNNIFDMVFKG